MRPSRRSAGSVSEPAAAGERIQKLLAAAGQGSRRAAEAWIRAGRVTVDGVPVQLGDRADPARAHIELDGRPLALARPVYWIAHKPRGVVTTVRDPQGRRTVLELLPPGCPRVFPVGRLDLETEGLVLLTNDGDVAQALLHPSLGSEREYQVTVRGRISDTKLRRLAAGVELEDGRTARARVGAARFDAGAGTSRFPLVLREGRKRQIRRSLAALGHPVVRLVRVRMGPLWLGRLPPGRVRRLRPDEVARLRAHARERRVRASAGTNRQTGGSGTVQPTGGGPKTRTSPRNRSSYLDRKA